MTRGVFISVFGKRGYGFAAWNVAFSIKKFSPDIPITIFCEPKTISQLSPEKQRYFDDIIFIPEELLHPFDPCKIKINVYDYLPYDINLVLDADSLALKDITSCFDAFEESGLYHATHIYKTHTIDKGRDFPEMWWAFCDDIWEHYKLSNDTVLPATNSSWQFIRTCDESKKLFDQVKKNYENPIPISLLKNKWGGTQPDELYLNISMAQLGFKEYKTIMFFGSHIDKRTFTQLIDDYYFLSTFGGNKTTKKIYTDWYDKLMFSYCREENPQQSHQFKYHYINSDKHMNNPLKLPKEKGTNGIPLNGHVQLEPSKIPIAKTIRVNPSRLIQSYPGPRNEIVKPTNYFNCSVCEFQGKKYFAYRMERLPWCTRMKIGICRLDENLQPVPETNVIPEVYTNLPPFTKGFHCEDPRLFVFNNELYLSYTDGYQMGQAKINPDTLQAEETFYIDKAGLKLIEKNWTFFDHEGKLYSVYDTSPHTIFEMNGSQWRKAYETQFPNSWKHGIIRGGTPPIRHEDYYISFFHSGIDFKLNGKPNGRQYFMGAYLFEAQPPFAPVAISKEPLMAGQKINESIARMWNKLYVVFPNGKFRKENSWCISFGYNDWECRFVEITDEMLEENLVWIKEKELAV